ncbi:MAG: hypothetical protein A2V77_17105 [Anaeromyxobacter sp. RBG_16_69_14]|nr:MAG: hypothetical protein A2V77_17105 [Anaeromyxobacter sp. RBG_16_69_14]
MRVDSGSRRSGGRGAVGLGCAIAIAIAGCAHRPTAPLAGDSTRAVKILAVNDFHGQLPAGKLVDGRPAGSAPVLAAYLRSAMAGKESRTVLVEAGDLVSASPASSALLQDEPTIAFFNSFANASCGTLPPPEGQSQGADRFDALFDPGCNLVGVPGNHEFDRGVAELMRLLGGGNHRSGPFLDDPWRGARFPVVASNVRKASGETLFRPYVVKVIDSVRVAFVGAGQRDTPHLVSPSGVAGIAFDDEATSINAQVPELQAKGIHAIVAVVHDGGSGQAPYVGPTDPAATGLSADVNKLVARLDTDVDVLVTAHTHAFANALLPNAGGREVLVVQANSAGTAFAHIDLVVDRTSGDVVGKTARIVTTFADVALTPDPAAARLTAAAAAKIAPVAGRIVARVAGVISRTPSAAGESPLGELVADAQRAAAGGADFAITNAGGVRADLPPSCGSPACTVTWGDCFAAQPFSNRVVSSTLTGQQLYRLLEQQWANQDAPSILQISGFGYTWSASAPAGMKVVPGSVRKADGTRVEPGVSYVVAMNDFLSAGGDGFTVLKEGKPATVGPLVLDALVAFLKAQPQPVSWAPDERVQRVP